MEHTPRLDVRFVSERSGWTETTCDRCHKQILESETRHVVDAIDIYCEDCYNKHTVQYDCGCLIVLPVEYENPEITYCSLHKAAPELLEKAGNAMIHLRTLIQTEWVKLANSDPSNQDTAAFLALSNDVDDLETAIKATQ
ncbi:MAG: hypothetical protein CEE38_23550 [Planctomycetes bacterium B3_Pla]|nr:MAG: hypothetical protein CEE38_23550 [Planctomycetes bacterium B3_Pla]